MKSISSKFFCIILYFIISTFVPGVAAIAEEEFSIVVKKTSEVSFEEVYLKDIAEINVPSFLKNEIGKIVIGSSPDPGEIKIISKDRLIAKIYSNHLIDQDAVVSVPDKIYVKRLTQTLTKNYLKDKFLKYVGTFHEGVRFDLCDFNIRGIEPYPEGKLSLLFDRDNRLNKKGRFAIKVDVLIDNYNIDTLSISGWIDVYERLVCARVPLKRHQKIAAQDLYYQIVNTSKLHQHYAKKIEKIEGKILKSDIKKGCYIKTSQLEQAPLVRRGEAIKLVAKREGLRIITAGISKDDGVVDDLIRVENLRSGKIIRGYVKGKSLVEVYY